MEANESSDFDTLPPHDLASEMCAIASIILAGEDAALRMEIIAALKPEDFYQPDNQIIFRALADMDKTGEAIDAVTLRSRLVKQGIFEEVGGIRYLAEVVNGVPGPSHGPQYAKVVRDRSILRQIIAAAAVAKNAAYAPSRENNADEVLGRILKRFGDIAAGNVRGSIKTINQLMQEVKADLDAGGEPAVMTGFRDLDAITGGIRLGEEWMVAARPSMGKSTLVRQIAMNVAMSGVPTAIISLEEGDKKIARNLLSSLTEIDNKRLRSAAGIHEEEWKQIGLAMEVASDVPLYVIDNARKIEEIRAMTAILAARHGVQLLVVDYLQRIQTGHKEPYQRVSYASQSLSDLFKEQNVAGIAVVQPSRANEARDNKRLQMSDLRDSGQLEQDADGILLLHREDYYHQNRKDGYLADHKAELHIAKMRDGERAKTIILESDLRYQKFRDCPQPGNSTMENYL